MKLRLRHMSVDKHTVTNEHSGEGNITVNTDPEVESQEFT
jgi:hypothetical protein